MALHLAHSTTHPAIDTVAPPAALAVRLATAGPRRPATLASHCHAVERAIHAMHDGLAEPLSLRHLAGIALLSPFHFNRVFCAVTGIPPCKFLSALRLDAAKRLLLTTTLSVTDICLDVGYHSLGSFTRDFTQQVGLPPTRFRRLADRITSSHLTRLLDAAAQHHTAAHCTGTISAPPTWRGLIFLGLFPTPIPHGRPLACTLLAASGPYSLSAPPGAHLLAIALPRSDDPLTYLLPDARTLLLGAGLSPRDPAAPDLPPITLRPAHLTDPPVLVALLHLLVEQLPEVHDASPRRRSRRLP